MADDRAVTVPTDYALMIGIVAILSVGLFVTAADVVGGQQEQALRTGLDVVGNRVATDLSAADRLARATDEPGRATVTVDLPAQVAGSTYTLTVVDKGADAYDGHRYDLVLTSARPKVAVAVPVRTVTPLEETSVSGGSLVIAYDPATGRLEVHRG